MLTEGGETPPGMQRLVGKITPLLRCAPLATPRGRCHGINDEHLRRGAGNGSPFSFLASEPYASTTGESWEKAIIAGALARGIMGS